MSSENPVRIWKVAALEAKEGFQKEGLEMCSECYDGEDLGLGVLGSDAGQSVSQRGK